MSGAADRRLPGRQRILCVLVALVGLSLTACDPGAAVMRVAPSSASHPRLGKAGWTVKLRSYGRVDPASVAGIDHLLTRFLPEIGRDFGVAPAPLSVRIYATHASFARALWTAQRQRPQSALDNTSTITRDTLLLGPLPAAYLAHTLTHVATEWTMDRLTGNRSAALPSNPWLYDGIAEYEAYRYAPAGFHCQAAVVPPFDVTRIRSPRQWLQQRPGPIGDLEYCLAYLRVRGLINRLGWHRLVEELHRPDPWDRLARIAARRDDKLLRLFRVPSDLFRSAAVP